MAAWQDSIDISQLFADYKAGKINIAAVGNGLADKLASSRFRNNEFILGKIDNLRELDDVEHFDDLLEGLYDWGDTNKRLWIKTI